MVSPSPVTSSFQSSSPSSCLCLRHDNIQSNFPSKMIRSSLKRLALWSSFLAISRPPPQAHTLCPVPRIYPDIRGLVYSPMLEFGHGYSAVRPQVKLWPQHRTPVGTEGKSLSIQGFVVLLTTSQEQKIFWRFYSSGLASTSGQKEMVEKSVSHGSSISLCLVIWAWTSPNLRFNEETREKRFNGFIWPIFGP